MKAETSSESKEPRLNDGQIRVRGLTRRFGEHVALHPLDLEVGDTERGQITGLLGPNGSGKSTLMRMLTGLIRPDAGEAFVDGVRLAGDGTAIRARCSYSPGELSVYDEMRGDEHLSWFLRGRGREAKQRATELATSFELPLRSLVRSYSHGMKRQLLFAAALAPRVRVRILDEPTEGLDPSRRAQILDLMREDARAGTTILLSSHHLGEVARACDELIFLNRGRILARANSDEIESRSRQSLRLTFASAAETATAEQRFTDQGAQCSVSDEGKLNVDLGDRDPRPILAQLYSDSAWPEPRTLAYGELSLEQLYRNLYGVEGV